MAASLLQRVKRFPGGLEARIFAAECPPPAADQINIKRINLDQGSLAAGSFRRNQRCAAAREGIKHKIARCRDIEKRIGYESHGLDRGMAPEFRPLLARATGMNRAFIGPEIAAVAPEAAKADIVAIMARNSQKREDELVLAAVEAAFWVLAQTHQLRSRS